MPFVHWSGYEPRWIRSYLERFSDRRGTAARIELNLLDLQKVTFRSVGFPFSGYSLKDIERQVGFERRLKGWGGLQATLARNEASAEPSEPKRAKIMREVAAYNREDLDAMWAVLEWLRHIPVEARSPVLFP
jgi:predicted RecB family nuclease